MNLELVGFNQPSETRHFEKGRFDLYRVGPAILGRATYASGWRWSKHIAPTVGTASCRWSTSVWCSADRRSPRWMTGPSA
jgi:hypothetical protein